MRHGINGRTLPIFIAVVALAVCATVGGAAAGDGHKRPHDVKSKNDSAVAAKLSPDLQQQVADDSTAPVKVLVTLQSSAVPQAEEPAHRHTRRFAQGRRAAASERSTPPSSRRSRA